jgi:hypothetical protein
VKEIGRINRKEKVIESLDTGKDCGKLMKRACWEMNKIKKFREREQLAE